jgi:hypothetical protein
MKKDTAQIKVKLTLQKFLAGLKVKLEKKQHLKRQEIGHRTRWN